MDSITTSGVIPEPKANQRLSVLPYKNGSTPANRLAPGVYFSVANTSGSFTSYSWQHISQYIKPSYYFETIGGQAAYRLTDYVGLDILRVYRPDIITVSGAGVVEEHPTAGYTYSESTFILTLLRDEVVGSLEVRFTLRAITAGA